MSEHENEQQQNENEQQQQEETPTVNWTGPSQEEWQATQEAIKQFAGVVPTIGQMAETLRRAATPPVEENDDDFDLGSYIEQEINRRVGPYLPAVTSAAEQQGKERMHKMFDGFKSEWKEDFDYDLAEKVANQLYSQTGDATKAVEEGAKYALDYRKRERAAGEESYKERLRKAGLLREEPSVSGQGDRSVPAPKTYDEVIERTLAEQTDF
jgi:hypothetical protein